MALRGPEGVLHRAGILFVELFHVELATVFVDELGQVGVEGNRELCEYTSRWKSKGPLALERDRLCTLQGVVIRMLVKNGEGGKRVGTFG